MPIIAAALSLITTLIKGWLGSKDVEKNAVKTVIEERNEALSKVEKANKAVDRLRNDSDYADELQRKYERKDD